MDEDEEVKQEIHNKAPDIIYLQYEIDGAEMTWCVDRINDTDVKYRKVEDNE